MCARCACGSGKMNVCAESNTVTCSGSHFPAHRTRKVERGVGMWEEIRFGKVFLSHAGTINEHGSEPDAAGLNVHKKTLCALASSAAAGVILAPVGTLILR